MKKLIFFPEKNKNFFFEKKFWIPGRSKWFGGWRLVRSVFHQLLLGYRPNPIQSRGRSREYFAGNLLPGGDG